MPATTAYAPRDLSALTGFLNSLQSYSQDLVQNLADGRRLCHYTTLDGALGILGGDDLWLTHSRYSNDDGELVYGRALIDDVIAQRLAGPLAPGVAPKPGADPDLLAAVRERLQATQDESVYVTCFCERDNLLSQWRGYADNGGGVSIEFDPIGFTRVTGPDSPCGGLMRLWKVFYDEAQQRRIVDQCLDYPHWAGGAGAPRADAIAQALRFFMPTFKRADFREEEERRLIFTPQPGVSPAPRLRHRGGLLMPYYSLRELAGLVGPSGAPGMPPAMPPPAALLLDVNQVRVGPGRHKALNVESLRLLLAAQGRGAVNVEASTTTYRA